MTIDKKLEILKRAMELGANVEFSFPSYLIKDESHAKEIADKFPEFKQHHSEVLKWIYLGDYTSNIQGYVSCDN